ncbi:MAG: DUF4239 domain-containing protein [Burkholderiaceae bacterium]|nr:DUF4239 domain-containing protein [Burkholderiaceae bacterium]
MNFQNLRTYDHYGYALVAIVGTYLAVATITWLIQKSAWKLSIRSLHGVAPPFINIIGVLFGLTLAFIANDTWSAHERATNAVFREADSLRSLMVLSSRLDEPRRDQLRQALNAVAQSSAEEWPLLAQRQSSQKASDAVDALLLLIASQDVAKAAGVNAQSLMLKKASDLRDDRNLRIGLSQLHVNPLKWLGMAFLGLCTLLSIAVVHLDKPRAAQVAIVLFALSAAPTAAIVLIQGNPFQQPSSVTPQPIIAAMTR